MTLTEKLEKMRKDAKNILKEHPEITNIWFEFSNISMDEMREEAKKYKKNQTDIDFIERTKRMRLQLSCVWPKITCFCYSQTLEVQLNYVEKIAIKNV